MTAKDIDDAFFGDAPGVPPFEPQAGDDDPARTATLGETFAWVFSAESLPEVADDEAAMDRLRASRPDLGALSDRELVDRAWEVLDAHFRRLFAQHIYVTFLRVRAARRGERRGRRGRRPHRVAAADRRPRRRRVGVPVDGDVGPRPPRSPPRPSSPRCSTTASTASTAACAPRPAPTPPRFVAAFDEFLLQYGSRGPNEWEMRSPTWETEPDLALAAIDRMRLVDADQAALRPARRARRPSGEALAEQIAAALEGDPEVHGQFLAAAPRRHRVRAPAGSGPRPTPSSSSTRRGCACASWAGGWWSRPLRRHRRLRHAAATTSSTRCSPTRVVGTTGSPSGSSCYAGRRAASRRSCSRATPPPIVDVAAPRRRRGRHAPSRGTCSRASRAARARRPGGPGSCSTATIRAASSPATCSSRRSPIRRGRRCSCRPRRVVVDVGAPLSHAIIVSRELGIPCVVSVTGGTKRIPDGALVEVCGESGTVTVLEGSPG